MSNQEFHIPTPAEAQGQAQAAIEYAIATGMGHVEPRKINDKGVVTRATAVAGEGMFSEDYEVSYEDCGLTSDADEPSPYRDTVAHAYTPNGLCTALSLVRAESLSAIYAIHRRLLNGRGMEYMSLARSINLRRRRLLLCWLQDAYTKTQRRGPIEKQRRLRPLTQRMPRE